PRFLQATGLDVRLQQCEVDQIVLRAATADAFIFPRQWRKCLARAGIIPALEGREAARQRRKVRTRWVMPVSRQLVNLASARIIPHHSLCQVAASRGWPASSERHKNAAPSETFCCGPPLCRSIAMASWYSCNACAQ